MEAMEAIMTRRSVREFEDRPLSDSLVKKLVEAGMQAPSARNGQPWHFIILKDKDRLRKVVDFSPHASMAVQAQAGILVCADSSLERSKKYYVQDCSAATQNILLAAHANSLGAVWTGVYPNEAIIEGFRSLCKIPKEIIPISFVLVGYPKQKFEDKKQKRYDESKMHLEVWGQRYSP